MDGANTFAATTDRVIFMTSSMRSSGLASIQQRCKDDRTSRSGS
ncbi:hypothetical protein C7S13_8168 [Burkholderia cepacia]|nr:hypothetical protein [Burkholderia cepacia]